MPGRMKFFRFECLCCRGGIYIFLGLLIFSKNVFASISGVAAPFLQQVWQTDQGLPHDSVQALVQTRDGYIWIGTRRGVARFDGVRFKILETPATKENISSL